MLQFPHQETQDMMHLLLNLNILLFFHFLVPLLQIHLITGWEIVGPIDIFLRIMKSSKNWLRGILI